MKKSLLIISLMLIGSWVSPPPLFSKKNKPSVLVLSYHGIADEPGYIYSLTEATFESQIAYLKEAGFSSLTLDEFDAWFFENSSIPPKSLLITFDDGTASQFEKGVPILKSYGFSAVFFLIANDTVPVKETKNILKENFSIGSHSVRHKSLLSPTVEEVERELSQSKLKLENIFSEKINYFAYPFGMFENSTKELLKKQGYHGAFTVIPGIVHRETDPFELKRVMVLESDSMASFKGLVEQDPKELTRVLQSMIMMDMGRKLYKQVEVEANELLKIDKNNFIALRAKQILMKNSQFRR